MVKSIEEYTAEVSRSSENSRNALQNQINAIEGNLQKSLGRIEENYANQQNQLNNQKNSAASAASMQAGNSGGSFGGAANIANKKYYEQVFVPAQASLNTNYTQSRDSAESRADSNRLSLEQQLAGMVDEDRRLGLQRYYDELERERQEAARQEQLRLQRAQVAAAQAAASYRSPTWGRGAEYGYTDAGGYYFHDANGNPISAQEYANQTGESLTGILQRMAQGGDFNASRALAGLNNAAHQLTDEEYSAFGTLGIDRNGWGRRA